YSALTSTPGPTGVEMVLSSKAVTLPMTMVSAWATRWGMGAGMMATKAGAGAAAANNIRQAARGRIAFRIRRSPLESLDVQEGPPVRAGFGLCPLSVFAGARRWMR